jgi:type IV secretion system T-DNA border endonuclease VirD2
MSSGLSSPGFDPSPWIAVNAALAARLGASRGGGRFSLLGDGEAPPPSKGLHGESITGGRDEEKRRRLGSVFARAGRSSGEAAGARSGIAGLGGRERPAPNSATGADIRGGGSVSAAALLARGYQPAVVKVISYAHGTARATASAQYIERDEVELETHEGLRLPDKAAVAEEIQAWSSGFEKRSPSQDVVAVRVQLSGLRDTPEDRVLLDGAVGAAFAGHRHAHRIDVQKDGVLEARVVAVMARTTTRDERQVVREKTSASNGATSSSSPARPTLPSRIRVIEKPISSAEGAPSIRVFDPKSEATMKARIEAETGRPAHSVSLEPATPGHGRDALGQRLSTLVARGPALDHQGKPLTHAEDIRDAARDWSRHLRSQTPRDTMHMVVSAKAATDPRVFTNAVRAFLHDQFADHKFMFGVHTDKAEAGHIHAHAIVAVRSEAGTKLHPGPSDLAQWRVTYAAHAREHGLDIVATRAAEHASSRSYGPKDKSIVDVAAYPREGRKEQDRAYASDPRNASLIQNAHKRMETARANPIRIPMSERERQGLQESLNHWQAEAKSQPRNVGIQDMVQRLSVANEAGQVLYALGAVARSPELSAATALQSRQTFQEQSMPGNADDMLRDLGALNARMAEVSALLPEGSRQIFNERAARQLELIAENVDHQREIEAKNIGSKAAGIARDDVVPDKPVPEHHADNPVTRSTMAPVVVKAQEIVSAKMREARQAQGLAARTIETNRKLEAAPISPTTDLTKVDQPRALLREVEQAADQENREAKEVSAAALSVTSDPVKPIAPALTQNDRLAELRRKQAEALERLARERAQSKDREHEAGD